MQVWPGHRYPLGATYDGTGTNFAIFSEVAEAVELCLFDPSGNERKVQLHEQDATPAIIRERDLFAVVVAEGEVGCRLAGGDHGHGGS